MVRDAYINRLIYLLNLFAMSVILLFNSYDFFLIIIAWELIGIYSFLLVNFYSIRVFSVKAALKTFIFSRFSDAFIFLLFIFLIFIYSSSDLSEIFLQTPFFLFYRINFNNYSINCLSLISFFITLAAVLKAAQFIFHV